MGFAIGLLKFLAGTPVFAQGLTAPGQPPKLDSLLAGFDNIIYYLLPVGVLASVAMVVYGGYLWITSGGEPDKKQRAQGTLTWAIVGVVFLFLIRMLLSALVDTITSGDIRL